MVAALAAYDFTTVPNFLSFSRADVWIDLLTDVRGVSFAEATAQALAVAWDGLPVRYIGLAALRRAKAASTRPWEMLDLENLPPRLTSYFAMPDITPDELRQRQQQETLNILDVREPYEVEESRIEGSQNIPLGSLPQHVEDLENLKNQEVIVHCKSGARSAAAQAFLQQHGFTNVRNLVGGITAYNAR